MPGFGSNAVLGISRQNSFGTVISSLYTVPFANHDFSYTYGELNDDSIQGRFDEPDRVTGIAGVTGNVTMNFHPLVSGFFLRGLFGTVVTSVVGSGFRHVFDPATTNFDTNATAPPIQLYVDQGESGVSSGYNLYDCFVNNGEISINAGGYLRTTYAITGRNAELIQKKTPLAWPVGVRPLIWSSASISVGGSAITRYQDMSISFNNNLGTQDRIAGAKAHTYFFRDGFRQFGRFRATADMAMDDWLRVRNETELRLVANFLGVTSISSGVNEFFQIDIPRLVYTAHPLGVSGAGMVTVALEGRAMYHAGSGTVCTLTLQNTIATSVY